MVPKTVFLYHVQRARSTYIKYVADCAYCCTHMLNTITHMLNKRPADITVPHFFTLTSSAHSTLGYLQAPNITFKVNVGNIQYGFGYPVLSQ